jgi:hypothetical protein
MSPIVMVRDHPVGLFATVMVSIGKPITSFTSFLAMPAQPSSGFDGGRRMPP